jgi:2-polyprenyl-3-methyl-5-hydroxy-6-metoxy-1,4-benzoquinol methylase
MQIPASMPSPERIFDMMNAFQRTEALRAAIELDLFTAIGPGDADARAIAEKTGASPRGIRILCDFLVVQGLLEKHDGLYRSAPDAAFFLNARSPAYMGDAIRFLNSPFSMAAYRNVAEAVRRGGTTLGAGSVEPDHPVWVEFARGMAALVRPAVMFIADVVLDGADRDRPMKVLDVAAGHGFFGIELARRNPRAEIHPVDWSAVLDVARGNAAASGVADRYHPIVGSAFEVEFGGGYDVALLTNFFHHFDRATCVSLMRKVHAALSPGGRAVTLEFVPNPDRVTPPVAAAFSFIMLNNTPAGDAYTFAEFEEMLQAAGFSRNELHQVPGLPQSVIVSAR